MNKLFKEISESKYGEWVLYAIGGLVSVSIFPKFSLSWLWLNIVIFYFIKLKIPFLSTREVAEEISTSWLFDGYKWECVGNDRQAIDSFTKAIQYHPDYFQSYQRRGNAYRKIKEDRQAIDDYQQAIDIISKTIKLEQLNAANYYSRALIYHDWMKIDASRMENAIENLTKAIDIDSTNNSFYFLRAVIYCYSGCEQEAIEDFTTIIKLRPTSNAYYNRGVSYYQSNNYQSAIEDLDMVINLDGSNISAYYVRGNARYELQDKIGAFEDYDRAKFLNSSITMPSGDEDGFYARGIAYIRLGNRVKAIEDFQMAESLCLEYRNTSLLKQIREEHKNIFL
jgi:tetratricopeptide (TPR) repeat protein